MRLKKIYFGNLSIVFTKRSNLVNIRYLTVLRFIQLTAEDKVEPNKKFKKPNLEEKKH